MDILAIALVAVLALLGVVLWNYTRARVQSNARRPIVIPPAGTPTVATPPGGGANLTEKLKGLGKQIPLLPVSLFALFNFALWVGLSQWRGEAGRNFFWDTWMWSGVFWLLALIVIGSWFATTSKSRMPMALAPFMLIILVVAVTGFGKNVSEAFPEIKGFGWSANPIIKRKIGTGTGGTASARNWREIDGPDKDSIELLVNRVVVLNRAEKDSVLGFFACESGNRQYEDYPTRRLALRGRIDSLDRGAGQINIGVRPHLARSVETLQGNVTQTIELFREHGSTPWNKSKPCWGAESLKPDSISFLARIMAESIFVAPAMSSPTDTVWSDTVHTERLFIRYESVSTDRKYLIKAKKLGSDLIQSFAVDPAGTHKTLEFYPEWILFASPTDVPLKVGVTWERVIR